MAEQPEPDHVSVDSDLLREIRSELDCSTDDISRLTDRIQEQAAVVERLETVITEMLHLLPRPAIVVDAEGHIAAVSQGAQDDYPEISPRAVGEPATAVLPNHLGRDIIGAARSQRSRSDATHAHEAGSASSWIAVNGAKVIALPQGWAFAVLQK